MTDKQQTRDEFDEVRDRVLLEGFINPSFTTLDSLVTTGVSTHRDNRQAFDGWTKLIARHRPDDLEPYLQGIQEAGVPSEDIQQQRQALRDNPPRRPGDTAPGNTSPTEER